MGILLGGVRVPKGKASIIGGGQAGTNAAKIRFRVLMLQS